MSWKLGSLFDGSGGFPLAASLCGVEPVWASEVEPYPIAVTRSRFPNMKHLGDISKINGAEIEPVDIITFGSPCQDLSVAGKRAGLKHEANGDEETTRSGLFMEAVRIIREMREATNGEYPRFALWENVPGAFSSNKGEDFRIVLEELIKIVEPTAVMPAVPKNGWAYADSYVGNGWSIAYRVFDAQYWGVPQRRRRIHLVADLGGTCAREVLFERDGVRGYFAKGGTAWESLAAYAEGSSGAADREGADPAALEISPCTFEPGIAAREGGHIYEGVCGTLRANMGDNQIAVAHMVLDDQGGQQISVRTDGKTPTLRAEMHGNVPCVMEAAGFCTEHSAKARGVGFQKECAPTLRAGVTPALVYSVENHPADSRVNIDESGKVQTLTGRMGTGGGNVPMIMTPVVYESHPMDSRIKELDGISPTVSVKWHKGAADTPLVCYPMEPITYGVVSKGNGEAWCIHEKHMALSTGGGQAGQGYPCVMEPIVFAQNQRDEVRNLHGVAGALAAEPGMKQQTFIAQPIAVATQQGGAEISETGVCPTLTAAAGMSGNNQPWICQKEQFLFENHSQDTRYKGPLDVSPILSATFGMGGNNQPFVVERQEAVAYNGENITSPLNKTNPQPGDPCHTLGTDSRNYVVIPIHDQATRFSGKRGDKADGKGNGFGVGEAGDPMNTLTSGDRHAVAFAMQGFGDYKESDVASGMKARDYKDATDLVTETYPIALDRAFFNQGQNALYDPQLYEDGSNPTLVARGPNAVCVRYIVRRLTPVECARLQGFADGWGEIEEKKDFTDEEWTFWAGVRNTHAEMGGKATKSYTKAQMLTWYNKLHTDSAEYKMWGNGIALPPALYCMQGIADVLNKKMEMN